MLQLIPQMHDQQIIELFEDLIPAPNRIHVVVPGYEGQIALVQGAQSKAELLFQKGALVVGIGSEVRERFSIEGTSLSLCEGDRVFLAGHFSPEWTVTREGYEMLVLDGSYIASYQKPQV